MKRKISSLVALSMLIATFAVPNFASAETPAFADCTPELPANMMTNPNNGLVFGNATAEGGTVTKENNRQSGWNNEYQAYEGYFIEAVAAADAGAAFYSNLAGVTTTNGAGGLTGKTLEVDKPYVLSFLARNAGTTDSVNVNFGLGNTVTWASWVNSVENGADGFVVTDKNEWTKVAGTLVAPAPTPYLTIGFPDGTEAGTKLEFNLSYLPEDAIYFAEEVAYELDVTADKVEVEAGDTVAVSAELLNQVGTKGTLSQDFDWYVVNEDRTEQATGFDISELDNTAQIIVGDSVAAGNYAIVAVSDGNTVRKGIPVTVKEKEQVVLPGDFKDTLVEKPANMMTNPNNGNVFGNATADGGTVTKAYNQGSAWKNEYQAYEGYFIEAVKTADAGAAFYSNLAGVTTTNGVGGLTGKTLEEGKAYVLSFLARNAGTTDSVNVNFGLGNTNTWASWVNSVENGADGFVVTDKNEWTKVAGTLVAPATVPYLTIGFPDGAEAGTKLEFNLSYLPEDAIYFAEEVAYELDVTADKVELENGDTVTVSAELLNQIGTKGTLSQEFDWYVVNEDRTEQVADFTISETGTTAEITVGDSVEAGNYVIVAVSAENTMVKGIPVTVKEKEQVDLPDDFGDVYVEKPANMMDNPTSGNVFGNANSGTVEKKFSDSPWNNAYNTYNGYQITAVSETLNNASYANVSGITTTNVAGGLLGDSLVAGKAYVVSFLARNNGTTDSFKVNMGLTNADVNWAPTYTIEKGTEGYSVSDKVEWTKIAGTIVAPGTTPFLSIGFMNGEAKGSSMEFNLAYLPEEAIYFAEEVAYDLIITADTTEVEKGNSIHASAEVLNQIGTKGTLSQDVDWYVINEGRTSVADGFVITQSADGVEITPVDAPAGKYYVFAKSAAGIQRGIEITVKEACPGPVVSITKVDMGDYQCSAWDVIIKNFDSKMKYIANFVSGKEKKVSEIGTENVEVDRGSVAFAVLLKTSRVNVSLDIVAE